MDRGLATVIGMSIAYVASFLGLVLAYVGWRRRRDGDVGETDGGEGDDDGGIRASLLFFPVVPGVQDVGAAADSLPVQAPPGGPVWSVVVPALLFLVALGATVLLYRRFTRDSGGGGGPRS